MRRSCAASSAREEAEKAKKTSEEVFTKGYSSEGMPSEIIEYKDNMNLMDILVMTKITTSKSEARRLIIQGGIKVNNEKMTNPDEVITINDTVVSKGKKNIIKVTQ